MYIFEKVILLGLFRLSLALSKCSDSGDFRWNGPSGSMTCERLAQRDSQTIEGQCNAIYGFKSRRVRVQTRCHSTCNNCEVVCQSPCEDKPTFRYNDNGTQRSCSYLSGGSDRIRNDNCETKVQGVGDFSGERRYLEEVCPRACNNCCD